MKKTILAIGLLLTTNTLFAAYKTAYTPVSKIVNVTAYRTAAIILLDKNINTPCKQKNRIILAGYDSAYKATYSTILAAKVSDRPIRIGYTSKCTSTGLSTAYSAQIQ